MIKVKTTCPLGSECETSTAEGIERCAWYVKMQGKDPQTGQDIEESRCAMSWLPTLQIESNGKSLDIARSIQSLRNETIERQNKAIKVLGNATLQTDS